MSVRFADSSIDKLFAEKNMLGLYQLIDVISEERQLPEEFWLFCRLLEWTGSARSGIWQYYDGISEEKFRRIDRALERFELLEIAERYRDGMNSWDISDRGAALDNWIDANDARIESAALGLIEARQDTLKHST